MRSTEERFVLPAKSGMVIAGRIRSTLSCEPGRRRRALAITHAEIESLAAMPRHSLTDVLHQRRMTSAAELSVIARILQLNLTDLQPDNSPGQIPEPTVIVVDQRLGISDQKGVACHV